MIDLPYEGATPEQLRSPYVRELLAVHDMFRNQLSAMTGFIDELIAGGQQLAGEETKSRIQSLIRSGAQYAQMLHHHHHLESASLFPALQEQGLETPVIDRLNAEHDEIAVLSDQFSARIRDLSAVEPGVVNHDMRRLADALHAHLAYEEMHVCPFLARFSY